AVLVERHGRQPVVDSVRGILAEMRDGRLPVNGADIAAHCAARLEAEMRPSLRRVFNLTGTVLHTNLGRAPLPEEAVTATAESLRGPTNLEFELDSGNRGDRTDHVRGWLKRLTGAEAATVVNNNAAAVFLLLNTLAARKEVPVSRGELIEIGGAFRMPDIMARAGCKLVEVGTTNRTHLADFANAVGPRTALIMKVHPSNYAIEGFTSAVGDAELSALAHKHNLPFAIDLGSGTLVDLAAYGLPHEPTPMDALKAGADLVTFSGDKLLGGPQAGIIVGKADLVRKLDRNPLKRALRLDKGRLAALEAVLRLYADPDRLAQRLPALRLLTRKSAEIKALGDRILAALPATVTTAAQAELQPCRSQIGSGSLPVDRLESWCLSLRPARQGGTALARLAASFRALPVPVIGRIEDGCFKMDLRCLEDEPAFVAQLPQLQVR
ncbi:MAG: L-seryl-tRNA(Sec) selenium transferase, partial [Dongiaceae bacterium]